MIWKIVNGLTVVIALIIMASLGTSQATDPITAILFVLICVFGIPAIFTHYYKDHKPPH